jgi:hypothetical protein
MTQPARNLSQRLQDARWEHQRSRGDTNGREPL